MVKSYVAHLSSPTETLDVPVCAESIMHALLSLQELWPNYAVDCVSEEGEW